MAQSKVAKTDAEGDAHGLMIKAMAYVAKYAKDGPKVRLRPGDAGVHKKNRGGDYPSGLRCKELLEHIAKIGIIQDEVDNHGYAVEEMPVQKILEQKTADFTSSLEYNVLQCAKDELLSGLYDDPFHKVFHSFLAHNHVLTICRAVLHKQLWRLGDIQEMKISFCDHDGRLSLEQIASSTNGQQLRSIIHDGIMCKVLSWKMDCEEPDAAATISTAFNELNSAAMRTTELQAFQVLKGEIIIQMSKDVGQTVAFQTTVDRVKNMLGPAVADPDLILLFEFLISNGVGKNSYIDDFLYWANASINPNLRRLRFAAFGPINKMQQLPLSRCAVAKRAYRGKPTAGYCPNPEPVWGTFTMDQLTLLEELLRFFHIQCKDILNTLSTKARLQLLGNVDIAAAQAFHIVATAKSTKKTPTEFCAAVRDALLKATFQWAKELNLHGNGPLMRELTNKPEWIVFGAEDAGGLVPAVAAHAAQQKEDGGKQKEVGASVIHFDEASSTAMNKQESAKVKGIAVMEQALPWRAWQSVYAEPAATKGADHGAAVAVLHTMAYAFDAETTPLEVCDRQGRIYVRATRKIPAKELMLPPSTANGCSLVDSRTSKSTVANAVDIAVRVQRNSLQAHGSTQQEQSGEPAKKKQKKEKKQDAEKKGDTEEEVEPVTEYLSEVVFSLAPEWKAPALTTAANMATQDESGLSRDTVDGNTLWPPTPARVYKVERSLDDYSWGDPANVARGFCKTSAAMSLYWAIRRTSASDLEQANKGRAKPQSFNCGFEKVRIVNVCVGMVKKQAVNQTRNIEVPFITNLLDVEAGEELLLEKPAEAPRQQKAKQEASKWKTAALRSGKGKA